MAAKHTPEALLRLLRAQPAGFVSGATCSRELGVSRSAIWKQVELLRAAGYTIEAVTARGYRLLASPDLLLPGEIAAGLQTQTVGRDIRCFDKIDSTNLRAWQLGEEGAVEGTVVIADSQSAGKGRLGRFWVSPAGVNLYLSLLLRPPLPPRDAPQLTFLSALAVARAVEVASGMRPTMKWPNDVLLGGAKVAGLLNEMSAETERINFLVLGIGVNLNMDAEQFPSQLRYPATSLLLASGRRVARVSFCQILLAELDRLYRRYLVEGFAPIRAGWEEYFSLVGNRVSVDCTSHVVDGKVIGIDVDGALLLQLSGGGTERILAGDVRPLASPE